MSLSKKSKEEYIKNMISHGIADTKYLLSGIAPKKSGIIPFCPVTVPDSIDHCFNVVRQKEQEEYHGMFDDPDFLLGGLKLDLVAGYFLSDIQEPLIWRHGLCEKKDDFESQEKTSRLEGELRRFGADHYGKDPRDVIITDDLVRTYSIKTKIMPIMNIILQLTKI